MFAGVEGGGCIKGGENRGLGLGADGVPVTVAPFDSPFGRTFTFTDPDGYAITIHDQA